MENTHQENESFIRWQGRSIEELGKAINLLLTLSLATIGFVVAKLLEDFYFLSCFTKYLIIIGSFVLLITTILLLILIRNRLVSIRKTAQIARKREKGLTDNLQKMRDVVRSLDKSTWTLFNSSVLCFIIGQTSVVIGFIIEILNRK